ncbi:MAG TPA: alpha/beta hydrolase [Jatrophihabitans sp.]|nr:alpha/beta hydrolase [Jatrophihabitans sp.]
MRRKSSRLVVAATVALACLISGCTAGVTSGSGSLAGPGGPTAGGSGAASGPATPAAPTPQPAQFFDCSQYFNLSALPFPAGREQNLTFQCALVPVSLDYSAPAGSQIKIALVRIHDKTNTGPHRDLLVNPGGPGGSGINYTVGLSAQISDTVLQHFDLVGFDPRGVGSSDPVRCESNHQEDVRNAASPDVSTPAGFARAKQLARSFDNACEAKYGAALPQINTLNTARDMDQLRQALGDQMLYYLGFSYGTELGSVYAHLFPHKVAAMVLDGAVDPLTGEIAADAQQLKGFEGAFDQFASWCRDHAPCSKLGDPRAAVEALAARASRDPIPTSTPGDSRRATNSLVLTGVLGALYSKAKWPDLGNAVLSAQQGDAAGLLALADQYNERYNGHYTNLADANVTINCNDAKPGPSDARIRSIDTSWTRRFPIFGAWSVPSLFYCQQWQPDRTPPPLPTAEHTAHKVLVVGNLHDPATPYKGAQDLAKTMGNAELLTWNGEGHTSYLEGSTCIDTYVNNYLVNGTLPPAETTCQR